MIVQFRAQDPDATSQQEPDDSRVAPLAATRRCSVVRTGKSELPQKVSDDQRDSCHNCVCKSDYLSYYCSGPFSITIEYGPDGQLETIRRTIDRPKFGGNAAHRCGLRGGFVHDSSWLN